MNPQNDQQNGQVGAPPTDQLSSSTMSASSSQSSSQAAAADLIRGQIDNIYDGGSGEDTPHTTPTAEPQVTQAVRDTETEQTTPATTQRPSSVNGHGLRTAPPLQAQQRQQAQSQPESTYQRTMSNEAQSPVQPTANQWQEYHSAWQKYYQLYYERYYLASVQAQQTAESQQASSGVIASSSADDNSISREDAMKELRESIRKKVTESATKVKKSRHFIPAIAGVAVLVLFMFLQYNRVIAGAVATYTSPGNIDPQNIIADPTATVDVGPEPRIIIPKINVDAPTVYGIGPDYKSQMAAMEKGVAHFSIPGANATPGQYGNTVLSAHSSNDVFAAGDYKFVFAQNEKLTEGDLIYLNYESKRYAYAVTHMEVVLPTEVSKVQIGTDKPMLTLISCVPLGTAQKRLLIFAEQVSPDPKKAEPATPSTTAPSSGNIPGSPSPTLLERIFGAR